MGEYGYMPEGLRPDLSRSGSGSGSGGSVHDRILSTLQFWLQRHPRPDDPALNIAGLGRYSPRELTAAVAEKNEVGQFFEMLIVNGARAQTEGLEGVLRLFREEGQSGAIKSSFFAGEF
jgi:hypothetical protein